MVSERVPDDHRAKPVSVTAIWLRREGPDAVVLVEIEGARNEFVEVIREFSGPPTPDSDVPFSHIAEAAGIRNRLNAEGG